ncbi:MAG: hypothetical protein IJN60_04795 [Oscillospiraceae bacterium]|nr:hypothetical protein [Oscillospiraceae bacterium]
MKKLLVFVTVIVIVLCLSACANETVTLHCDGANCNKTVSVKVTDGEKPDESWVVFCDSCAKNDLAD